MLAIERLAAKKRPTVNQSITLLSKVLKFSNLELVRSEAMAADAAAKVKPVNVKPLCSDAKWDWY